MKMVCCHVPIVQSFLYCPPCSLNNQIRGYMLIVVHSASIEMHDCNTKKISVANFNQSTLNFHIVHTNVNILTTVTTKFHSHL